MASRTKPITFRLGVNQPWLNRWFFKKSTVFFLEEDTLIRDILKKKILNAGIAGIEIERTGENIKVMVSASRPGLIIGRGGKGVEELKNLILKKIKALRRKKGISMNFFLNLSIEELKRGEVRASVMAQQIAADIEKRFSCRTVMRRQLELLKHSKEVQGARVRISGRLNGAEISRKEQLSFGRLPLQTLRANIDFGEATAFTSYGTNGVKVWIYKGEIFN